MKLTRVRQLATTIALLLTATPALRAADGSLEFSPASQQRVEMPNFATLNISTEVTVEFWAHSTRNDIQQSVFMLNPDTPSNRFSSHINYFNGSSYWDFGDINSGGRVSLTSPAAWLNNWTHFALVASQSGGMKIYANGVQVASEATFNALETVAGTDKLSIGGIPGYYFQGKLDDFRIWNIARSVADIRRDLGGPLTGGEAGLRLYYKFDEASGSIAENSATATGDICKGYLYAGTLRSAPARSTYVVTNNADSGFGSLRGTLATAAVEPGPALITFDPGLSGQIIKLTTGIIEFTDSQGATIDASSLPGGVTIFKNGDASSIFGVHPNRSLTLRGLTLTGNTVSAIQNSGTLTLAHCTLYSNSANDGGAIFNYSDGTLTLTHCTFNNNSASQGGAIYNFGTVALTHCTLAGNRANSGTGEGGAIYSRGTLTLNNCIVAGNTALVTGTASDNIDGNFTGSNNITSGTALAAELEVDGTGNPVLKNNGGPTWTIALTTGPAVDAGAAIIGLTTDQRGLPRSVDGDGDGQAAPDLGAVELNPVTVLVTTAADELDTPSSAGSGKISLREAISDGTADIIKFSTSLNGQTLTLTRGAEIVIGKSMLISTDGLPAGLTVDGGPGTNRLFTVASGRWVTMQGLSLTGGDGGGAAIDKSGGAILNLGILTLQRCTFSGNTAFDNGGAIHNDNGGASFENPLGFLNLTHCTLVGNSAGLSGGAIYINAGFSTQTLTHCTLSENSATYGGGIYHFAGSLSVTNSIIAENTSTQSGSDIYNTGTIAKSGVSLVKNYTGDPAEGSGTFTSAAPLLTMLANYGGPTKTMPPLPGSPAIDAVPLTGAVAGLAYDQRRFARDRDGDANGSALPDIGAVEANPVTVTTAIDELASPGEGISLREAVAYSLVDYVNFAPALDGGTIILNSEIPLASRVTIDTGGLPDGLTIDGGPGKNRIFNITGTAPVRLTGLTLTGGEAPGGRGGALLTAAGTDLTVYRCTLNGNTALEGGAIFNAGRLALERCTFSGNTGGFGGALQCQGLTTITHCTIAGNHGSTAGGGIFNKNTTEAAPLTVAHSIVANNTSPLADGRDIFNQLAELIYDGANNVRFDFNDRSSISGINGGSLYRGDPELAPLGRYGGPTETMALTRSSLAWNRTTGSTSLSDQRGFPMVGVPDLGAYEAGNGGSYSGWSWENFGIAYAFAEEDPDKDGRGNFYEYATLTDPLVRNNNSIPTFERNATTKKFTVTIKVRRNQENLIYQIQRNSKSLAAANDWTIVATYDSASNLLTPTVPATTTATMGTDDVITITDEPGGATSMFYRVKFSNSV